MKTLLLISVLFLSSCAEFRSLVATNSAEGADAALESAEWTLCKASSAGSLERRYHLYSEPESGKAVGWRWLCYGAK